MLFSKNLVNNFFIASHFLTFNTIIFVEINDFYKENDLTLIIKVAVEKNRNSTTINHKSSVCSKNTDDQYVIPLDNDIYVDTSHDGTFYDGIPHNGIPHDNTLDDNTPDDNTLDNDFFNDNLDVAKSPVMKSPIVNTYSKPTHGKSSVVNTYGKSPIKNTLMLHHTSNTTSRHDSQNSFAPFTQDIYNESSSNDTPVKPQFMLRYTPRASSSQSCETSRKASHGSLTNLDPSINHVYNISSYIIFDL